MLLGVFQRNGRENVIIDMDRCNMMELGYGRSLVLYLTPDGQIVGKVVEDRYVPAVVLENDGGVWKERMSERASYDWLSELTKDGRRVMPEGFLEPEDTRW